MAKQTQKTAKVAPAKKGKLSKINQIRLSDKIHQEVKELAQKHDRTMTSMIRVLLDEAIYYRKIGMSRQMAKLFLAKLGIDEPE